MKRLFLILIFYPFYSFSQNLIEEIFPIEDGRITYQEVVSIDSLVTGKNVYLNARNWMVDAFRSSKDVIQFDDSANNSIIAKGFIAKGHNNLISNPKIWFSLKIEAKNGRYRYKFYDVQYEFDVNFMDVHKHFNENFEKWGDTSKIEIANPKKKEKALTMYRVFYHEVDNEFKSLIASLKNSVVKKEKEW